MRACRFVSVWAFSGAAVCALIVGLVSCAGKKKEETRAYSIADLKLSEIIYPSFPDGLVTAAGGAVATLTSAETNLLGKKSSPACRAMEQVNFAFEPQEFASQVLCHIEVGSQWMQFGTKYQVTLKGGDAGETVWQFWVDNSNTLTTNVYLCKTGTLKTKYTFTSFSGAGSGKGSARSIPFAASSNSYNQVTGGFEIDFDFSQSGYRIYSAKAASTYYENTHYAGYAKIFANLKFGDSGTHSVAVASLGDRGLQGGENFSDQSLLKYSGNMGQVYYVGKGIYSGNAYDWKDRATFGSDGMTVANTTASGDVVVSSSDLITKPTDSFTASAPTDWDCTGTTESVVIDTSDESTKTSHDACDKDRAPTFTGCMGSTFERGQAE